MLYLTTYAFNCMNMFIITVKFLMYVGQGLYSFYFSLYGPVSNFRNSNRFNISVLRHDQN